MDPRIDEVLREADRALQYALDELDHALPFIKEATATAYVLNVRAGMRTTKSRLRDVRVYLEHHPTLRERLEAERALERLEAEKGLPKRPLDPVFQCLIGTGSRHLCQCANCQARRARRDS